MLQRLKSKNPDKEYPSNTGQKWTEEEEKILIEELNKNIDIELIAKTHNRTTGGIQARRKEIAYKMYRNNRENKIDRRPNNRKNKNREDT